MAKQSQLAIFSSLQHSPVTLGGRVRSVVGYDIVRSVDVPDHGLVDAHLLVYGRVHVYYTHTTRTGDARS